MHQACLTTYPIPEIMQLNKPKSGHLATRPFRHKGNRPQEVFSPPTKNCWLAASRLLGGHFLAGKMVWWRDDCKPINSITAAAKAAV